MMPTATKSEVTLPQFVGQDRIFLAVAESAMSAVIISALDGTIVTWNPAAQRLYQYTAAEAIGSNIELIIPEDRRAEHLAAVGQVLQGGPVREMESVRVAKDGRRIVVSLALATIKSSSGQIIGIAKITRDSTAQKTADEIFRLAVESCPSGMVMMDGAGKIAMVNGEMERMFGYDRAELIGQPIELLVPENLRSQHLRHRESFAHNRRRRPMSASRGFFGQRKDGSRFPVEIGLNPIQTSEGAQVFGVIVDITARMQADETFRLAVEAYPSAVVMIDGDRKLVMVNSQTEKSFGYLREELIDQAPEILVPARLRSEFLAACARCADRRETERMRLNGDLVAVRKDGTEFPVEIDLNPIPTREGLLILGVIVDISERRRIDLLKDDFVSTVSHELRTPLTSIAASLGLLNNDASLKPKARKRLIAIAHSNSKRLIRLINDILIVEKMESGRVQFVSQRVEVRSLIADAIEAARALADGTGVTLSLKHSSTYEVQADPDRLTQVITNLLSNAIKFSPPGADVLVAIEAHGVHVRITVQDQGPGIPENFRNRIFEKFAQADTSNARQKGGTGLGLNIARQIVMRLGGEIGFEDAPGGGTRFYVDLPRCPDTAGLGDSAQSEKLDAGRILVCGDDRDAAGLMQDRLHEAGYATDISGTAADAIARAATTSYSAILIDLTLPDRDGISLIQELRRQRRHAETPIVVVSANPEPGRDDRRAPGLNVRDWLTKPLDLSRLQRALHPSVVRSAVMRILHLDHDPDVLAFVAMALSDRAEVISAATVEEARRALAASHFDLAIVELAPESALGFSVLSELHDSAGDAIPVIVYSALGTNLVCAEQVRSTLAKSGADLESLIAILKKHAAVPHPHSLEKSELA